MAADGNLEMSYTKKHKLSFTISLNRKYLYKDTLYNFF